MLLRLAASSETRPSVFEAGIVDAAKSFETAASADHSTLLRLAVSSEIRPSVFGADIVDAAKSFETAASTDHSTSKFPREMSSFAVVMGSSDSVAESGPTTGEQSCKTAFEMFGGEGSSQVSGLTVRRLSCKTAFEMFGGEGSCQVPDEFPEPSAT